jgi:amidase
VNESFAIDVEERMNDANHSSRLDASAQAELVRRGELSPAELIDAYEARLRAVNPLLRAVVTSDLDAARERARVGSAGPFAGVPFLVKDVVAYPGMRCSLGSRLFASNVAQEGSPFTERLDAAGLVTVGKTATSELGLLGSTETLLEGVTHNPWDLSYSAGGSSGGAAAAVAAGLVPLAHANDGGGSIRVPASICGVFGLKPSRGRTAPTSIVASDFADLVSDLCVSRTVRDTALFLSVVEAAAPRGLAKVGYVRGPSKRRLRIGAWTSSLLGTEPDADVRAAFERTASLCRELGHEVVEAKAPALDGRALSDGFFAVAGSAISGLMDMMSRMLGRAVGAGDLEPFTLALVESFRADPGRLAAARSAFERAGAAYTNAIREYDVVLTPALSVPSWRIGHLSPMLDTRTLIERTERAVNYTCIQNIAGVPAMSVPLALSPAGMPIGSHFAAPLGGEAVLLELAYELEAARPFQARLPPYTALKLQSA